MTGAITEDDDPFKEMEEEFENLCSIQPDLVSENMDAASFTDVHSEVLAVQIRLSKQCKGSPRFQKMVQCFTLIRTMLLT